MTVGFLLVSPKKWHNKSSNNPEMAAGPQRTQKYLLCIVHKVSRIVGLINEGYVQTVGTAWKLKAELWFNDTLKSLEFGASKFI